MKIRYMILSSGLLFLLALLNGCRQQPPTPFETLVTTPLPANPGASFATPALLPSSPTNIVPPKSANQSLFIDTESVEKNTPAPYMARSRIVKVNLALLLDENKRPRNLNANTEITINLFPDVNYTGVIEQVEQNNPGSYSWVGHLKGVEYSKLIMVFSGGIFIANISSPSGVYEVSIEGGDLYRIIMIDQSKFGGEEGDIHPTPTSPTK